MRTVSLAGDVRLSALGQGTWYMGDDESRRADEIAALRTGIELGLTTIDTAEMYGSGRSERLVGEAIAPVRNDVQLVSKVLPSNASRDDAIAACEASLKRLRTDRIDLYLLHWRGSVPVSETVEAFERLQEQGKIAAWGVSNFDLDDIEGSFDDGSAPAVDQVYYSLEERGIEYGLLDTLEKKRIGVMAYTPFGASKALLADPTLGEVAARNRATPSQVALAFLLRHPSLCAIPKAGSVEHVRENAGAASLELTADDLEALDRAFPPPERKRPLAII